MGLQGGDGGEKTLGLDDRVRWIMKKRQKVGGGGGRADRFCNCALGGLVGLARL